MKLISSSRVDHGKCFMCPANILPGESYYQTTRYVSDFSPEEFKNLDQKKIWQGRYPVKFHKECWNNKKRWEQVRRGLMRIVWGSTLGRVRR